MMTAAREEAGPTIMSIIMWRLHGTAEEGQIVVGHNDLGNDQIMIAGSDYPHSWDFCLRTFGTDYILIEEPARKKVEALGEVLVNERAEIESFVAGFLAQLAKKDGWAEDDTTIGGLAAHLVEKLSEMQAKQPIEITKKKIRLVANAIYEHDVDITKPYEQKCNCGFEFDGDLAKHQAIESLKALGGSNAS